MEFDKQTFDLWTLAGGGLPDGWDLVPFRSLLESERSIAVGVMYPGSHDPSGTPLIRVGDIQNGSLTKEPDFKVSAEVNQEYRRTTLNGDELLITLVGNPGVCVIATESMKGWNAARAIAVAKLKDSSDRKFVKAVFESQITKHIVKSFLNTTVQPTLNLKEIKILPIPLPPKNQRARIAEIISFFSDKIELNRRMNATLEAMARAMFKAWFVDFEPVHANKENRSSTSASPEIAKLFPSDFENGIPKGWHIRKISECCDVARGASPRPIHDFIGDDIPWVKIADATAAGSFFIFETKEKIKASGKDMSVFLKKGSLILSNSATCGIPMFLELDGCIHDGWLYFENYRGISSDYLFEALARMTERLVGEADGTVQKNLNTGIISRQDVVVPSAKLMCAFENVHMSLFEKIKGNTMENRKLSEIRDSLLPRLISGKIFVGYA